MAPTKIRQKGAYTYDMLLPDELPNVTLSGQDGVESHGPQPEQAKAYIEKVALLGSARAQFRMSQAVELGQLGYDLDPALPIHYPPAGRHAWGL
ncbi:hypothetical protein MN608_11848 [Microdochium nivale]|nr:hypothetical protein MN608_11848 [Microdochium nivale]